MAAEPRGVPEDDIHPRSSSFLLTISVSVGYDRRRAMTGKWEGTLTSVFLLVAGSALVGVVVWEIFRLVAGL
jgi:hypothetical protein